MNAVLFISTGSSVHGIFQERILEWVATSYSSESSLDPQIKPSSLVFPALASRFFTTSNTWEATVKMNASLSISTDME